MPNQRQRLSGHRLRAEEGSISLEPPSEEAPQNRTVGYCHKYRAARTKSSPNEAALVASIQFGNRTIGLISISGRMFSEPTPRLSHFDQEKPPSPCAPLEDSAPHIADNLLWCPLFPSARGLEREHHETDSVPQIGTAGSELGQHPTEAALSGNVDPRILSGHWDA